MWVEEGIIFDGFSSHPTGTMPLIPHASEAGVSYGYCIINFIYPCSEGTPLVSFSIRLVFISNRVGVAIIGTEPYVLVKINLMEAETECDSSHDSVAFELVQTRLLGLQAEISSILHFCI